MRIFALLIIFLIPYASIAQNYVCPDKSSLDRFLEFDDLYFGELHGTNEIPEFFKCLVEEFVHTSDEPIIVSLEMAEYARDPASPFWGIGSYNEDGRSSQAMFQLVQYLVDLENQELLKLHFQHGSGVAPFPKDIGSELRNLSEFTRVIALSGNIHSMKSFPPNFPANFDTEGMFVGPNFTHISFSSVHGGEIWACIGICGIQPIKPSPYPNATRGALVDGSESGHDYIYYLDIESFSPSEPMDNIETQ